MNAIKVALRVLSRQKWFTGIHIIGLSLGVMCSLIILLYVDFHLSADSYHRAAERTFRLVLDIHTPSGTIEHESGSSVPMREALRDDFSQIEATAFCMKFYSTPTITVYNLGRKSQFKEENTVAYADNEFINVFDHVFIQGDRRTALINPKSVVLSEQQALKYFGTTNVIGETVNINNKTDLTVTGVISDSPAHSDLRFGVLISLATLKVINPNYQDRNFTWIGSNNWVFVVLKDQADAGNMDKQLPAFVQKYLGPDFAHWNFHLQPLSEMHFDVRYGGTIKKEIIWVLTGVALALICIVCVNYINLSIAQSINRSKAIGIRKCLGGRRWQLFFQFILETAVVVVLSVAAGLAATYLALPLINTWMEVDLTFRQLVMPVHIAYLFLFVLSLILLAGYYPAVILSGIDSVKTIKGEKSVAGISPLLRKGLISFQYFIALLFLISTLVISRQVKFLLENNLGFSSEEILTIQVPKAGIKKLETFRDQLESIEGVVSASIHHRAPISTSSDGGFIKYEDRRTWEDFIVRDRWADEQFVRTYSLELVAGRNIIMHDSLTEVMVNEAFVRRMNIGDPEEVLGKSILFDNSAIRGQIVGVVRDFHHRSLQNEIEPLAIYPFPGTFNQAGVKIRAGSGHPPLAEIETIWKNNFPDDVLDFSFLDESIARMYRAEQVTKKMMTVFTGVSVIICGIGVLGLSVFSTLQRTKEIGVRKVLGASASDILFMLSTPYLGFIALAALVAVPVTYALMNIWLSGFAYHASLGWLIFVLPVLVMAVVTSLLVATQALKTVFTNPTESLRYNN